MIMMMLLNFINNVIEELPEISQLRIKTDIWPDFLTFPKSKTLDDKCPKL